jgi:transposase
MVEGLRLIRKAVKVTETKIEEICRSFPEYACLLTIPGFRPDVSSKVLGALGNPHRFLNHKQVLKTAGLDLSANRSGKTSQTAVPIISKQGKADLRYALYQAALVASNRNIDFMRYYTQQLQGREKEPGIKTKRKVKLSAKLLIIAWTLMKKKEPFNSRYFIQE